MGGRNGSHVSDSRHAAQGTEASQAHDASYTVRAAKAVSCRVWVVVVGVVVVAGLVLLARLIMRRMMEGGMGRQRGAVRREVQYGRLAAVPGRSDNLRLAERQLFAWTIIWDAHRGVGPPWMFKHVAWGRTAGAARAEVSYGRRQS